jgi:dolichol-phosphate mannosyltransferase
MALTPHPASRSPIQHLRLTVVIPTYNEADNLPEMARALFALPLPHLHFLVVDDNSPDGTGQIADRLAARYNGAGRGEQSPRMTVIHRGHKGGLGTAYVAGFTRALQNGADFVVQMDADFSHKPDYIPTMLETLLARDADVVVGSRYVDGGSLDEGWGVGRRFLSWWANLYSRMILGLKTRDMTAGFKVWRRAALLGIDLQHVRSNGYSFQVEMAYLCEALGYTVVELPIHFEDRRIGQSKLDIPVKIESAWRTWQIRRQYRHLRRAKPIAQRTGTDSPASLRTWDAGERPSSTPQG